MEPETPECKPVLSRQPVTAGSQIHSELNHAAKLAVTDVQAPSCPSVSTGVRFTSTCFSPSSLVCLRPLTSFADISSSSAAVTGVTDSADYRVSRSVVKQEYVPGSFLSVKGSAGEVPQPNGAHLSTETPDSRSAQFAGSDLTAQGSEVKAVAAGGHVHDNPCKSSKTVAASSDTVSAPSKTSEPRTNAVNSKDHVCSKAANVDDALKGKRRQKSNTDPRSNALPQCRSEGKSSSAKQDVKSRKRKFQKTEESGIMFTLLITVHN